MKPRFYDFFAGAGLATLGLGPRWQCVWANDIDERKQAVYAANFGGEHFVCGDVAEIDVHQLPAPVEMAWASFPCQDLSLAGWRRGLSADRSGTFWEFWRLMRELRARGQRPPLITLENVTGLLYGSDFAGLCEAMAALDLQFGALVIDARHFVPQSRPRVFVVGVDARVDCSAFVTDGPVGVWSPNSLTGAWQALSLELKRRWRWWNLPAPQEQAPRIADIVERTPTGVEWHPREETERLMAMMTPTNLSKLRQAAADGGRHVGFLYRRTRNGVQRAEVRFDGTAGCLRTPLGGSSRQTVVVIDQGDVRTRLLSAREAARLMGADDSFVLPARYNEAYHAMGDGVAAPAVRWLSERLLLPVVERIT